jgi:hypothetical protein
VPEEDASNKTLIFQRRGKKKNMMFLFASRPCPGEIESCLSLLYAGYNVPKKIQPEAAQEV